MASSRRRVDIGILTIRDDEFRAVLSEFPDGHETHATKRREYTIRQADAGRGARYELGIIRQLEQGNGEAQTAASDLIADLQPRLLLVVGIAGGLPSDDFTLGDVVVGLRINDYTVDARKWKEKTTYNVGVGNVRRPLASRIANLAAKQAELGDWTTGLPSKPRVTIRSSQLYGPKTWQNELKNKLKHHYGPDNAFRAPIHVCGTIATSDRLVKDPSLLFPWIETARALLAVEMESGGAYRAAQDKCPMLPIRGISDLVGLKRSDSWTKFACASAAAFTAAFLRTQPVEPRSTRKKPPLPAPEVSARNPSSGPLTADAQPSGTTPTPRGGARPHEEKELQRVREFVTRIRNEVQRHGRDIDALVGRAAELHRSMGSSDRPFDDDARSILLIAQAFHNMFYDVDEKVYSALEKVTPLRTPALRAYQITLEFNSALAYGQCNYYAFENAVRVFNAVRSVCNIPGTLLNDRISEREQQISPRANADLLVAWMKGNEIFVKEAGSTRSASYRARSMPLEHPALRVRGGVEVFAHDFRTIYRWDGDDKSPAQEWQPELWPGESLVDLVVFNEGPIDFAAFSGRRVWIKRGAALEEFENYEPEPIRGGFRHPDPLAGSQWVTCEWLMGHSPTETLSLHTVDLARVNPPTAAELVIAPAMQAHARHIQERHGLRLACAIHAYPARYQGFECLLLVCTIRPNSAAICFLDLHTGHALRAPAIAPTDVADPLIRTTGGCDQLICRSLSRQDHSLFVFDISDSLDSEAVLPSHEFGEGSPRLLSRLENDRIFVSFYRDLRSRAARCGYVEWVNDGPHVSLVDETIEPVLTAYAPTIKSPSLWTKLVDTIAERAKKPNEDAFLVAVLHLRSVMQECQDYYSKSFDQRLSPEAREQARVEWIRTLTRMTVVLPQLGKVLEIFDPNTSEAISEFHMVESLEMGAWGALSTACEALLCTPDIELRTHRMGDSFKTAMTRLDELIRARFTPAEVLQATKQRERRRS